MNERVDKGNEVIEGIMMECVSFMLDSSSSILSEVKSALTLWDFYKKTRSVSTVVF